MAARIIGTGGCAAVKIPAGRIVDRVHPNRTAAQLRTKRVDERLPDTTNTRRLRGAASEHDLDVRARIRGCGRDLNEWQCPCRRRQAPTMRAIRYAAVVSMLVCRTATERCHMPEYINPSGSYFCRTAASRARLSPK